MLLLRLLLSPIAWLTGPDPALCWKHGVGDKLMIGPDSHFFYMQRMCVILQGLPGFIAGRLKLFHNVLNEHSASWMMFSIKLLSPGTVLQSLLPTSLLCLWESSDLSHF